MIGRLNHVAIATKDIVKTVTEIQKRGVGE